MDRDYALNRMRADQDYLGPSWKSLFLLLGGAGLDGV
jgi:hypothetical protein